MGERLSPPSEDEKDSGARLLRRLLKPQGDPALDAAPAPRKPEPWVKGIGRCFRREGRGFEE